MTALDERCRTFHRLHESGCFVIPNPWDIGSARLLVKLGFKALATTSSGSAWSRGRTDGNVPLEDVLAHLRDLSGSVSVPISADFESGFADDAQGVEKHVGAAATTGIAGLSIEDSTGNPSHPLFDFSLAVERVHAAREAIAGSDHPLVLTARSEGFIRGRPDLAETIRRLVAYGGAGAVASTRRGSEAWPTSRPSSRALHRSRSTCSLAPTSQPSRILQPSAFGESASAARWRVPPGPHFFRPPRRLDRGGMTSMAPDRRAFLKGCGLAGAQLTMWRPALAGLSFAAVARPVSAQTPNSPTLFVDTDVLRIAYEQSGDANGFPIILLHGFPDDVHAWDGVAPPLARAGHRVLVPYLRGYGPTRFKDASAPRMAEQAAIGQDVIDFANALRLPRFAVAGYDWGGRAAAIAAALHPDRVRATVLIGGYTVQNTTTTRQQPGGSPEGEARLWYQWYFNTERGRAGLQENRRALCRYLWQTWSPTWHFTDETLRSHRPLIRQP